MSKLRRLKTPWDPVELTPSEFASIKAVHDGVAHPEQQRIAFRTIVQKLCNTPGMSFAAGGEEGRRATDFAEGKRWVGFTMLNDIVGRAYPVDIHGAPPPMPDQTPAVEAPAETPTQGDT